MTAVRPDLIRSPGRQHFVGSGSDVVIELRNLFIVEKFIPRLHRAVGTSIFNREQELFKCEFQIRICQVRS